jgi:uncharacterized RDD family membrane protein YckC
MDEPIEWPAQPPTEPVAGDASELPPPPPEDRRRPVASILTRGLELVIEGALVACTFGFGWVGWWIVVWADGQTPAKGVLHIHVVNAGDGRLASFGRMALREAIGKGVAGAAALAGVYFRVWWLLAIVMVYLAVSVVFALTDVRRRTLWDRLAGTVVVEGDPPPLVPLVPPSPAEPAERPTAPVEASTALS